MFKSTPIEVDLRNGAPHRFRRGRRVYRVRRTLESWVLQSRWWGREEKRVYFRLDTDRGVVEIYRASEFDGVPEAQPPSSIPHLPATTEGDTHTRELRRTDSAYRPDARKLPSSSGGSREMGQRWMLSRIID